MRHDRTQCRDAERFHKSRMLRVEATQPIDDGIVLLLRMRCNGTHIRGRYLRRLGWCDGGCRPSPASEYAPQNCAASRGHARRSK